MNVDGLGKEVKKMNDIREWLKVFWWIMGVLWIILTLPFRILQGINCLVAHNEYILPIGYYINTEGPIDMKVYYRRCSRCNFYWGEWRPGSELPTDDRSGCEAAPCLDMRQKTKLESE